MNIGIIKEQSDREHRVALTPAGVHSLVEQGTTIYIEQGAGNMCRYQDDEYEDAGATIVYQREEAYGRADLILKVSRPAPEELAMMNEGKTLFSFLHLPVAGEKYLSNLISKKINSIGFELVEDNGTLPILYAMSEIAGSMSVQIAARYLETTQGGRGVLLGGIAGVPPAAVVVLGAGVVGISAAQAALGAGAHVIILDRDVNRLRTAEQIFRKNVTTAVANQYNLSKSIRYADVFIGAIMIKGERSPVVVTEGMVKTMKSGAVIVDVSIDQGGCVETSRPTSLVDPVFVRHNVVHYCVPNIPSSVARTATNGLNNAVLPYLLRIQQDGLSASLKTGPGFAKGVCTYAGKCTNDVIARRYESEYTPLEHLLQ